MPKGKLQWVLTLAQDFGLQDISRVLEPILSTKTITADKLRRKLNEILDYATVKGHRIGRRMSKISDAMVRRVCL